MKIVFRFAGLIAISFFAFNALPTTAQPLCYMIDIDGKMQDLTSLCTNRQRQTTSQAQSTRAESQKRLVYTNDDVETYIDLATLKVGNYTRRINIERVFSSPQDDNSINQSLRADITCPDRLQITQFASFDQQGRKISERFGGDLMSLRTTETQAITQLLCSATSAPTRPVSTRSRSIPQVRVGVCDSPWDRDSRGRLCGNRAASRRSGGR